MPLGQNPQDWPSFFKTHRGIWTLFCQPLFIPSWDPLIPTKSGKLVLKVVGFFSPDSWLLKMSPQGLVYSLDVPDLKRSGFSTLCRNQGPQWRSRMEKLVEHGFAYKPVWMNWFWNTKSSWTLRSGSHHREPLSTQTSSCTPCLDSVLNKGLSCDETAQFSFHALMDSPINTAPGRRMDQTAAESQQIPELRMRIVGVYPFLKFHFNSVGSTTKFSGGKIKDVWCQRCRQRGLFFLKEQSSISQSWKFLIFSMESIKLEKNIPFTRMVSKRQYQSVELNYSPHHFGRSPPASMFGCWWWKWWWVRVRIIDKFR